MNVTVVSFLRRLLSLSCLAVSISILRLGFDMDCRNTNRHKSWGCTITPGSDQSEMTARLVKK